MGGRTSAHRGKELVRAIQSLITGNWQCRSLQVRGTQGACEGAGKGGSTRQSHPPVAEVAIRVRTLENKIPTNAGTGYQKLVAMRFRLYHSTVCQEEKKGGYSRWLPFPGLLVLSKVTARADRDYWN